LDPHDETQAPRARRLWALLAAALIGALLFVGRAQCDRSLHGISPGPGGRVLAVDPSAPVSTQEERPAPGDRVRAVADQEVSSLAQIGAAVRALDPDDQGRLPVSFERYDHSYSVRLHFHRFQEEGFPPEVKDGDRLVRYGDQDVPDDEVMDQDSVLAVLARYAGESVDFVFVRPSYRFTTRLPVGSAPLPILQLLLFLLGVGVAGAVAWWRRRAEAEEAPWWLLSAVSVAAPWGMSLLLAPDVALWDPPRLAAGLVALALWRPLSLLLHRALRGPLWRGLWIGALAPGALLGAAGLLALLGALAGIGADGGAPEEAVVNVIRAAAAFVALCQVVDLGWWLWERRARPAPTPWPLWGVAASSLALLPAAASLISDPERFSQGGFLLPTAAMLLILWVGDMTLFVSAAPSSPPRARERAATGLGALSQTAAADFFAYLRDRLAPDAPVLVVVQGRQARCLQPVWGDDEDMPELSFFDAGEIWRAAVGLLRDERMSLPISLQEEEASPSSAEAVRGLSDKLGWTVAFCLLDEALQMDSPSHELRERALYAFLVVERGLCEISPSERDALRDGFRPAWAHLRARFLAHEAPSPLRAPEPEPAPGATLEPAPSLIAAVPAPSPAPAPESTPAPEVVATPEPAPEVVVIALPAPAPELVVLPAPPAPPPAAAQGEEGEDGEVEEALPTVDPALAAWLQGQPDLQGALGEVQTAVYLEALRREAGNKSAAARLLGIKRSTLARRLKERGGSGEG
jgi:hypothetical protein